MVGGPRLLKLGFTGAIFVLALRTVLGALGRRQAIRAFLAGGGAVASECAGLLCLGTAIEDESMCGVLPFHRGHGSAAAAAAAARGSEA